MAARVRFLSLSLAGFGRYDRPTRFVLDGRSCSFTSANELGKSTFHAGLFATLFGPPPIRAKLQIFQERFRSWNKPPWFWGEVDFAVSDERWRVRRDFESGDLKVWRLASDGISELRYEERVRPGRKPTEPDPYARLLEDWLGIGDRSVYEAMFVVSQDSSLAASWQIDPRIAERVYGPAVKRLSDKLQELFDQFREITRNTRDSQVMLDGQGERNGRNDGRLDQVVARVVELENQLAAARERTRLAGEHRARLEEFDDRCESLRAELRRITESRDAWQAWLDLESRLRPAVESYERLRSLNERCQQLGRPLAELRARLAGELAAFDDAPSDVAERLEYFPLLIQAVEDAKQRQAEQQSLRDWRSGELVHWQQLLATEFAGLRGRPEIADQVEELQLVGDEISAVQHRVHELKEAANGPERAQIEQELARFAGWQRFGPGWADRLAESHRRVQEFATAHAEYSATVEVVAAETRWLAEETARIDAMERMRQELASTREQERAAVAASLDDARTRADAGRRTKEKSETARAQLARRYVDFDGAPDNLLELWDQLRAVEKQRAECRVRVDRARESLLLLDRRTYWRRGLTMFGVLVTLVSLLWGRGWVGWFGVFAAAGIAASLRWIYRIDATEAAAVRDSLFTADSDQSRAGRERDSVAEKLGPRFVVPPERESEWRRLWPTYRRERETLAADARLLPSDQQLAELAARAASDESRLAKLIDETNDLLADSDDAIVRAKAEAERRGRELDRLQEQLADHRERYFGTRGDEWSDRLISALPDAWRPVVELAEADGHAAVRQLTSADDLIAWCRSLDDASWQRFADECRHMEQLEAQLTPDAAAEAARTAALSEAEALLGSLEQQQFRLADAVAPFSAESDVGALREQARSCQSLEAKIARREQELAEMSAPESLAAAVEQSAAQLAEASVVLGQILERFDREPARASAALNERAELARQIRELEAQIAAAAAADGFDSVEQLAHEAGRAEGLVGTVRGESQELLAKSGELWEAVGAAPELAAERRASLESRRAGVESTLTESERERAELAATVRQMAADPAADDGAIGAELQRLRGEQAELEKRRDEIADEFQEAGRLMHELQRVERTALEGRITAYFADFSRTPGRRVELDDDLRIRLKNDDGTRYAPDQLSHGARDQLYLAVYFATTAGLDLPFILDDPFVNCDAERLAAIRACWDRLVPHHQLILLSHEPHLASWAPALEMREAA